MAAPGGSHSSPAAQSMMSLPQVSSLRQSFEQPSPPTKFPSSQISAPSTMPLPQSITWQSAAQVAMVAGSAGSQGSPASQSVIPLPQVSSLRQSPEQPSLPSLLPSSQTSSPSMIPLPQPAVTQPARHPAAAFGGSHSSPASQSTMPLPQDSLLWQSAPQPSPPSLLPSSQTSPPSTIPLPQYMDWQVTEQPLAGFGGSHSSPASQSTMPLPQDSLLRQSAEQPSPETLAPSSQTSPASTSLLPQYMTPQTAEQLLAASGGSHSSPAAQSVVPLPQDSSLRQSAEQPSPPAVLPSSHTSPASSSSLPQVISRQMLEQPAAGLGGSHSSFASQSMIPLPQDSSLSQPALQPSPSSQLPSSHTSPGSTKPLPQYISWHSAEQPATASGGSHASPVAQSTIPFPQISRLWQSGEQPSPPSVFPSSQTSPGSMVSSPHPGTMQSAVQFSMPSGSAGSQASPVAQSTMPLPQVSSERQSLEQPSPSSQLPSSQISPGSTKPSPQYIFWHTGEQPASASGGSQASPASQSMMPLPHSSVLRQSLEQPSPPSLLPSSQTSPSSSTPSPHSGATNSQLLPH